MLRIRKEQMEAFSNALKEAFNRKMIGVLETLYPDTFNEVPLDEKKDWVEKQIQYLLRNGVYLKADMEKALKAITKYYPDYPDNKDSRWLSDILEDDYRTGTVKAQAAWKNEE